MDTNKIFELLLESGKTIASEIELEKVVQRVTDIGTELSGAQFGAFFYNRTNQEGELLLLYTISGVAREAFAKFPMPRNTKIFAPTFAASGTVRYHDVTEQPHFGQNDPYFGMPKGHLPVKSYLAVPVVSSITKEPIGGLFFGHSEAGIFTPESEKLIEGLAAQAAIAVTNARLFEEKKATEKKLLEQREQYRSIFNATSDSITIYDQDGTIVEVNPAACQIFGYTYEEMVGLKASVLFQDPKDFDALKEIALSGRQYAGVNTRIKKDGTTFEADFKGSLFVFKGKPHVFSVVKNITPEKVTKEALKKSEALTQIISNASPAALWMTNSKAETIYINQTWLDWVGGKIEDHLGLGWLNAILPEDREITKEKFWNAFAERKLFNADFRIRRRNGEVRWCLTMGSPYYGREGQFVGFAGSLTDITDRKMAEEQLASSNVLINTITNNTRQALFLMDDRQRCSYMNPAAEKMIGFKLNEVQEMPLHYYIHHTHPDGRHFPIEECAIDRALPTKSQTEGEEVFIRKDGTFFPVAFTASPIIEKGVPIGTVIEVRDTTEEKRVQEELRSKEKQAMALLEEKVKERTGELERRNYELLQFTSVASHDLKEPVRKISVFSNMLKEKLDGIADATAARHLDRIISSASRMGQLIDDLLTFSRLSHHELPAGMVDLNAVLARITDDLEIGIKEKEAVINQGPLPVVKGVESQLHQVFQNLISNSLKFVHPDRSPLITIETTKEVINGKPFHRITYNDNGIGFSPDQAEKIFEVFYRLHTRDQYEGTGVGLAIVKKIVEAHNGHITAIGEKGKGATFLIYLPAENREDNGL